jgi:hypothetical protein
MIFEELGRGDFTGSGQQEILLTAESVAGQVGSIGEANWFGPGREPGKTLLVVRKRLPRVQDQERTPRLK